MMKIHAIVLAAAAFVFAVSTANAEPFNGTRYIYSAPAGSDQVQQPFVTTVERFNERGQDTVSTAHAGGPAQEPVMSLRDATEHGWNS